MGTANLFEAIRMAEIDPIIQLCSTSEVYGQVDPKNVPIKEDCPINPTNPYAVSKLAQDSLAYTYFKSYGMKIIRTRMFAYLNPRRSIYSRLLSRCKWPKLKLVFKKNCDTAIWIPPRTLIDVRDAMESYWEALLKCRFGEAYNIGGATVITVGDFLNVLKRKPNAKLFPALIRLSCGRQMLLCKYPMSANFKMKPVGSRNILLKKAWNFFWNIAGKK